MINHQAPSDLRWITTAQWSAISARGSHIPMLNIRQLPVRSSLLSASLFTERGVTTTSTTYPSHEMHPHIKGSRRLLRYSSRVKERESRAAICRGRSSDCRSRTASCISPSCTASKYMATGTTSNDDKATRGRRGTSSNVQAGMEGSQRLRTKLRPLPLGPIPLKKSKLRYPLLQAEIERARPGRATDCLHE